MKVLHYSDKGVDDLMLLYKEADLLITTGDLRFNDFSALELTDRRIPSFGVYGNHDDGCSYLRDNQIENIHNRVMEYKGMKIGGFQGCPRYNQREMQYSEEEAKVFADTFPYVDILILHAGPLGLLDDPSDSVHIGSKNIRRYVDEKGPRYVFCGHQYSDEGLDYGKTKVFRTYGARIVDVELL